MRDATNNINASSRSRTPFNIEHQLNGRVISASMETYIVAVANSILLYLGPHFTGKNFDQFLVYSHLTENQLI